MPRRPRPSRVRDPFLPRTLLGGLASVACAAALATGHDDAAHEGAPAARHAASATTTAAAATTTAASATTTSATKTGAATTSPGAAATGTHPATSAAERRNASAAPLATAPAATPSSDAREPLDIVRERLAKRLGAAPPSAGESNVVRVVSRDTRATAGTETLSAASLHGGARRAGSAAKRPIEATAPAPSHPPHWEYEGAGGPQAWGRLDPNYANCTSGSRQSPIDIRDGVKVELDAVRFDYRPGAFRVVDTGHTVQVNVAPGNSIEVAGRRYDLVQFHFHRPSEERIDGRQFEMVAHLVHKSADGRLAVVAVLLERGPAQPIVQTVWNNLPLEKGDEVAARAPLDPGALLPPERRYYTYMGSLTTPPCSEGVLWVVMKQPVGISPEQEGVFARLYPMNARPLQAAAGRLIKESN